MICVNVKNPVAVAAGAVIPFDNTICATNGGLTLDENAVKATVPGWYTASLHTVVSSISAVSTSIYLCDQGNAVEFSNIDVDIAANGTAEVSLEFPFRVIPAEEGTAEITIETSAAVTVESAVLIVKRVV